MNRRALLAVLVAQVAVFAAITISVVNARDNLDSEVGASFDSAMDRLSTRAAPIEPLGCRKSKVGYYDCFARVGARVGARGRVRFTRAHYLLALEDDGCWTTFRAPASLPARLRRPRGCIDD